MARHRAFAHHVDIDLESHLSKLDGVLATRERHRARVSVQIVAFPQSGVMRCPGVLDLLDAAVREGADLVGGIDPLEIDRDPKSLPKLEQGVSSYAEFRDLVWRSDFHTVSLASGSADRIKAIQTIVAGHGSGR